MMYGMGSCCYFNQHFSAEACGIQNRSVVHLENLMCSVWKFFVLFYKIIIVSISKMISIICTCTCGLFLVKMFYWGTFARIPVLFRTCMSNFFSGSATFFGANPILQQQFLGKKVVIFIRLKFTAIISVVLSEMLF